MLCFEAVGTSVTAEDTTLLHLVKGGKVWLLREQVQSGLCDCELAETLCWCFPSAILLSLTRSHEADLIIIHILQTRKLKLEEILTSSNLSQTTNTLSFSKALFSITQHS